ncbi:hypothetical protein ACXR0O_23540 [Verrucomicrobiota bacterium sgz303538]
MRFATSILTFLLLAACDREGEYPSSASVKHSRSRGILVAEYNVPAGAALERYRPVEVWVEFIPDSTERQLVVRLDGPHVDREPRVRIRGIDDSYYRFLWSERNGPPYEMWKAPEPLPDVLTLERGGDKVQLERRSK